MSVQEQVRTGNPAPAWPPRWQRRRQSIGWAFIALLLVTLGCSASDLLVRPTPTPIATRALPPTFTPTPDTLLPQIIITPPYNGTPGVIIVPPGTDPRDVIPVPATSTPVAPAATPGEAGTPTAQPTPLPPTETATSLPTWTPIPTLTPLPTLTPTPFVAVESGFASLRTGPGVAYPAVNQLGPNIPITLIGRNLEGTWYQLCCVSGAIVWVPATHVRVYNDPSAVALVSADQPPPTPTPTFTPTVTGTPTTTPTATPYLFMKIRGPELCPTNNEFLTIRAKMIAGPVPVNFPENQEAPVEGYYLKVLFNGFERPANNMLQPSGNFQTSAGPGAGCLVKYNYKYEYIPPDPKSQDPNSTRTPAELLGSGTWTVYVIDAAGNQLSAPETFTTQPSDNRREIYIAWMRIR